MQTPWGKSDHQQVYIEHGIVFHGTPSHGGFKVYAKYNNQIPDYMRSANGWYEEDCQWSIVAVCFPSCFNDRENESAIDTLKNWYPDEYERFFLCKLDVNESCVLKERAFKETTKNQYVVISAQNYKNDLVKVCASLGGNRKGKDEKWFFVSKDEYTRNFVIDMNRHQETQPGFYNY